MDFLEKLHYLLGMRKKKALKSKGFPVKNKAEQNCHVPPPIRHPPPGQFPLCPFPRSVAILAWRAAMVCSAPNSTTRRALRQLLPTLLKNLLHHRPLPPPPRRPFLSSSVTAPWPSCCFSAGYFCALLACCRRFFSFSSSAVLFGHLPRRVAAGSPLNLETNGCTVEQMLTSQYKAD